MKMIIEDKEKYSYNFVSWLLRIVKYLLLKRMSHKQLVHLNSFVGEVFLLRENTIDVRKALYLGIQSLQIKELKDAYVIEINPTLKYPNTNLKVAAICRIVSYGSFSNKEYSLFTDIFHYVSINLAKYYNMYLFEYYL